MIVPLPVTGLAHVLKRIEQMGLNLPVSSVQLARADLDKTPMAKHIILTATSLDAGLDALAGAIDAGL